MKRYNGLCSTHRPYIIKKGLQTAKPLAGENISLAEFAAAAAKKFELFSDAACTWQKILLSLQTCELWAEGTKRVRCSKLHLFAGKPRRGFSTV